VTGLNATDNPAPGVGVLRSLGLDDGADDRLVGLAYDALDPGVYAEGLVDDVFLLPYPSSSVEAFFERLAYVHARTKLDVIIPTLDAELPTFLTLEPRLRALGIGMLLPTREQLDVRSKAKLAALGTKAGISVPTTAVVHGLDELMRVHERVAYPFFVKGVFYGAKLVHGFDEAAAAFHRAAAEWGLPIVIQAPVHGQELNVVAVGDGKGGVIGAVPMKKLVISDKGKGWAGITIDDPALLALTTKFLSSTRWRGPCEVEVIRDDRGGYHLLEINPRFPAWVHLAGAAGVNLPRAVAELAAGRTPRAMPACEIGKMFVRIALDQIGSLSDFERMVTVGEIASTPAPSNAKRNADTSPQHPSTAAHLEGITA
jgi:carbamoyl-phosphate synthase large subunit